MELREAEEIFEGVVLSDGSLTMAKKSINPSFMIPLSGETHLDWLMLIRNALETLGMSCPLPKSYPKVSSAGKPCIYCLLRARVSPFLTLQRLRWYPDRIKEVPEDLKITPMSLANEFMGDGNSSYSRGKYIAVSLCTMSYTIRGLEIIEDGLRRLGIARLSRRAYSNCSRAKGASGMSIGILGASINKFMNLIEPHIVPSFQYKIKRPMLK